MKLKYLRALAAICAIALACAVAVEAKNRKSEKLLKEGQAAEQRQDWDKALELYQEALDISPNDPAYIIPMRRARFQAGQKHVNLGQKLRADGKLEEALAEFQKALIADPASAMAIQEIKRTKEMLERNKQPGTGAEERTLTPAEMARRESDQRVASILSPPELKPITGIIPSLKMNNQPPKVLYETVGKLAGVNVVFDSQYSAHFSQKRRFSDAIPIANSVSACCFVAKSVGIFHTIKIGRIIPNAQRERFVTQ